MNEAKDIISKERNQLDLDQEKTGLLIGLFDDESLFDLVFSEVAKKAYEVFTKRYDQKNQTAVD
jgi:hypothetical protein